MTLVVLHFLKIESFSISWKIEVLFHLDSGKLVEQLLESQFCCRELFLYFSGSGWVGLGQVDGNSDNRANSAQFQVKLPTGAELGNT